MTKTLGSPEMSAWLNGLVGTSRMDAFVKIANAGMKMRVMREDRERFSYTADYNTNRVNVAVTKGVVTEVLSIG